MVQVYMSIFFVCMVFFVGGGLASNVMIPVNGRPSSQEIGWTSTLSTPSTNGRGARGRRARVQGSFSPGCWLLRTRFSEYMSRLVISAYFILFQGWWVTSIGPCIQMCCCNVFLVVHDAVKISLLRKLLRVTMCFFSVGWLVVHPFSLMSSVQIRCAL